MPCLGAPQAQGPDSDAADFGDVPDIAKTESSFETCVLSQFLQDTLAESELTIFSNFAPHSRHWNSKIGIALLCVSR
jgi:hypothetical protein